VVMFRYDNGEGVQPVKLPQKHRVPKQALSGAKLKHAIAAAGTTQAQLARDTGMTPQYISKIIADGTSNVTLETLSKLRFWLGCGDKDLLVTVRD
jgi:transcriptional regulator with XRE-family HTH domain